MDDQTLIIILGIGTGFLGVMAKADIILWAPTSYQLEVNLNEHIIALQGLPLAH